MDRRDFHHQHQHLHPVIVSPSSPRRHLGFICEGLSPMKTPKMGRGAIGGKPQRRDVWKDIMQVPSIQKWKIPLYEMQQMLE